MVAALGAEGDKNGIEKETERPGRLAVLIQLLLLFSPFLLCGADLFVDVALAAFGISKKNQDKLVSIRDDDINATVCLVDDLCTSIFIVFVNLSGRLSCFGAFLLNPAFASEAIRALKPVGGQCARHAARDRQGD